MKQSLVRVALPTIKPSVHKPILEGKHRKFEETSMSPEATSITLILEILCIYVIVN